MIWNIKNGTVPAGGSSMYYVSFGYGRKTLIVLPGLSDGLATVKGKALVLAPPFKKYFDKYTVYMFSRINDLPDNYSIKEMAADQAEAMKNLGIGRADVLGVSQGGMIAQMLAADHPDLVRKLILAVTAPYANNTLRNNVRTWIRYAETGEYKKLMVDTAEKSYSPKYLKKYRKYYPLLGIAVKSASIGRFLSNAYAIMNFDAIDRLERIICPVFIIGGDRDMIVGTHAAYELKKLIPGSKLHIYSGLGHAAYEEAPDFYSRIFDFLSDAKN